MQIINMTSPNGKDVPNQFIIYDDDNVTFQSYKTVVCQYNINHQLLTLCGDAWEYSATTKKYFKKFINEETHFRYETDKQFRKLITSSAFIYEEVL